MAMRNDGRLLLMALLFCIYTLTNAGGFHIVDEVSLFATTESLALRGAVNTNAIAWTQFVNSPGEVLGAFGVDGQVYSKKGPAPSFAAAPWFWLWPDETMRWNVLWVGAPAVGLLAYLLLRWWRKKASPATLPTQATERSVGLGGAVAYMASVSLPLLLLGVWTVQVRSNPRYGAQGSEYRAILQEICKHQNVDAQLSAIVTITPYSYQIPMNWLPTDCRRVPPIYGYAQNALEHAETTEVLSQLVQRRMRLWFTTGGLPPNAPENTVERWLADHAYKAMEEWYGDYRLVRYGTPALLANSSSTSHSVHFWEESGGHIQLMAQRIPTQAFAGAILPVEWSFQLLSPTQADLRWFTQLLKSDGTVAAQLDIGPDQGYATFSHLPAHHPHTERLGLELPRDLPAAGYRLIVGLYNPAAAGAPRLRTLDGADFVELTQVQVLTP